MGATAIPARGAWILAVAALAAAAPAHAQGRWQTFLHASDFEAALTDTASVWLASTDGGLLRYDRAAQQFESFFREPGRLASNELTALAFDGTGRLWIGTLGSGASRRSSNGQDWRSINRLDQLPSDSVTALAPRGDDMWIATRAGVAFWNGSGDGSIDVYWPNDDEAPFADNVVQDVMVVDTTVWVATRAGVYRNNAVQSGPWGLVSPGLGNADAASLGAYGTEVFVISGGAVYRGGETGTWTDTGLPVAGSRLDHRFGQLVAATGLGIYRWNGTAWVLVPHSAPPGVPPGPAGRTVTVDETGILWAANPTGLWRLIPDPDPFQQYWAPSKPEGIAANDLVNVLVQGSRVYATVFGRGVSRYDGANWRHWINDCTSCPPDTAFRSPAFCLGGFVDDTGNKWLGCWGWALERFDDSAEPAQFTRYWVTADADSQRHTWSWSAAQDSSGRIWIGNDTPSKGFIDPIGLDQYSPQGAHVANWQPTNSQLKSLFIRALTVDQYGLMWVAYADHGVDSFNPALGPGSTSSLIGDTYEFRDIYALVATGDVLWVMTSGSVERYSVTNRNRISMALLPPGAAPASAGPVYPLDLDSRGYAYVGTEAGLLRVRPDGTLDGLPYNAVSSPIAGNVVRSVRVDRARDIVWIATTTGLSSFEPYYTPPPPPALPSLDVTVFPNPARLTNAGAKLSLMGNAGQYVGEIFDLGGRKVRTFSASQGGVFWDGRDENGRLVPPGLYFIRVRAGGQEAKSRVVLLR
jgi:hypothetical protein